jgi:hypothetical protein
MVRTFCTMLVVRPQLAYCTDTSAKLGPLISDTPLEVDYCPSREASYTNANAQHLHRPWNFGSLEAAPHPPHSRCSVPSCCVQFVVEGQPRPGIGDFRGSTMPETRARVSVSFRAPVSSEGSTSLAQTIGR